MDPFKKYEKPLSLYSLGMEKVLSIVLKKTFNLDNYPPDLPEEVKHECNSIN
jgi:hypothetical protein